MTSAPAMRSFNAEDKFLLAVLRARYEPSLSDPSTHEPPSSLDWQRVLAQADRHGVIPLLWDQLHKLPESVLPAAVRTHFRASSALILRHNLALTAELFTVLDALKAAGIDAMPFKGPALAVLAYGNLGLRSFSDLDILIQRQDLSDAARILQDRGYYAEVELDDEYLASECQLRLCDARSHVVELHWRLMERSFSCPVDTDGLWRRRRQCDLAGRTIATLGDTDLFLYLCLHGSKHQWDRLEWICGIAELIGRTTADWTEMRRRAKALGCSRALDLGLYLAHRVLHIPLPSECRHYVLTDRVLPRLVSRVQRSIREEPLTPSSPFQRAAHFYFLIRSRERVADQWRILLHSTLRAPHPQSRELLDLPRRLRFVYYVLRPVRLAGTCVVLAWRWCLR